MQFKSYISKLETEGLPIPTTVAEALIAKEELLSDLIANYCSIAIRESDTNSPSDNMEIMIEKDHLLREYNMQTSELQGLMMGIHRAGFSAAFHAAQNELMEEDMRGEQ